MGNYISTAKTHTNQPSKTGFGRDDMLTKQQSNLKKQKNIRKNVSRNKVMISEPVKGSFEVLKSKLEASNR